jgi:hypothetical protein
MSVHVGRVTSEVSASSASSATAAAESDESSAWQKRVEMAAMVERLRRDRSRTATGPSHE